MIDEKELQRLKDDEYPLSGYQVFDLMDSYTAALRVVRAAQSLTILRYGIGIPLTKDPDILGKSFNNIQGMFGPLDEALKPFSSPGGKEARRELRYL